MTDSKAQKAQRAAAADEQGSRVEHVTAGAGSGETARSLKEANEKGFFGEKVDPTPNEHYTAPDSHTDPRPFTGPDVE